MTSIVNYKLSTINNIYFLLLLFCTQLIINTFFFLIVRTSLSRTDWGWHSICSRFRCFLIYMHTLTHSTKRMHTQIINSETYPLVIRFLLTLKLSASLSHSASFGIKKKKKWNPRLINTRCSHNWLPLKVFFFYILFKIVFKWSFFPDNAVNVRNKKYFSLDLSNYDNPPCPLQTFQKNIYTFCIPLSIAFFSWR